MATRMLQRRGTAGEWAAQNPVLSNGEIGFEIDTKIIKVGDGVTAWNDLTFEAVQHGNEKHDEAYVASEDVTDIVKLTQAQYDLLDPPNETTLYIIVEE